jgi:hypothetical protein
MLIVAAGLVFAPKPASLVGGRAVLAAVYAARAFGMSGGMSGRRARDRTSGDPVVEPRCVSAHRGCGAAGLDYLPNICGGPRLAQSVFLRSLSVAP